jgi:4-diphosphocytidyl-2-C-methyl-D-erythritol kinase
VSGAISERAPAKVNLLLHVGARRADGLHELCSLFASIDLADEVKVEKADGVTVEEAGSDEVVCAGVEGPNLALAAVERFRAEAAPDLPPLRVSIEKRIPVAAGLGGGSADAAAVLRAANELAGRPLDAAGLRALGARVGADVPSQIEPRHALVTGAGETVEPLALPPMTLLLMADPPLKGSDPVAFAGAPAAGVATRQRFLKTSDPGGGGGLSTGEVYREADRLGSTREGLDSERARALAGRPLGELAAALENDLEPAALSLRPDLAGRIETLHAAGALAARVTGSGPTVFGVFRPGEAPELPGAIVAEVA